MSIGNLGSKTLLNRWLHYAGQLYYNELTTVYMSLMFVGTTHSSGIEGN